ncbi:hypothetical protein KFL_002070160 [Klebsormidium nitens]|uniref:Uncharacterized protein n=1 Tax=Klebsormidium nitens TaxID=105231 RepID=A0A1Y1I6Q9_KLENI|nr:hypothetical protein KFL_002070160 [Klebsormidium nitens]|eukprot:GAQ84821.1 hypothetical protein KFL_002070160 [Klebsormidium nitens]
MASGTIVAFLTYLWSASSGRSLALTQSGGGAATQPRHTSSTGSRKLLQVLPPRYVCLQAGLNPCVLAPDSPLLPVLVPAIIPANFTFCCPAPPMVSPQATAALPGYCPPYTRASQLFELCASASPVTGLPPVTPAPTPSTPGELPPGSVCSEGLNPCRLEPLSPLSGYFSSVPNVRFCCGPPTISPQAAAGLPVYCPVRAFSDLDLNCASPFLATLPQVTPTPTPGIPVVCPANSTACIFPGQNPNGQPVCCPGTTCPAALNMMINCSPL